MHQALLRASAGVESVRARWTDGLIAFASRLLRKIGVNIDLTRSMAYAYAASTEASLRLHFTRGDVVVAIAAGPYVFALKTVRPVIYMSDATLASIREIYSVFSDMPLWLAAEADKVERAALHRSDALSFSSEWARISAVNDYGVEPALTTVMPLGPNINADVIARFKALKSADFHDGVRLLFIGADWDRKGGPLVIDIQRQLITRGIACEIFLVGRCPEDLAVGNGIHVLGRLDKSDPEQLLEMCRLFERAHFFVLPTSAEAYGIVFSEAQAFGCPSLTYAVGGTPTAVLDGVTGYTLPLGASAAKFADKICAVIEEPGLYERLSANCRARYEREANWNVWGQAVVAMADKLRRASLPEIQHGEP